jgi:murein DD-endopeptidase MepM/ murein hydrolase activator NlpD
MAINWKRIVPDGYRAGSGFGVRLHPVERVVSFHRGVDIPAPIGSSVLSDGVGKVVFVGSVGGLGPNTVIIEFEVNGKYVYRMYGHMNTASLFEGAEVEIGTKIGEVGSLGISTGPHLHLDVSVGEPPQETSRIGSKFMRPSFQI